MWFFNREKAKFQVSQQLIQYSLHAFLLPNKACGLRFMHYSFENLKRCHLEITQGPLNTMMYFRLQGLCWYNRLICWALPLFPCKIGKYQSYSGYIKTVTNLVSEKLCGQYRRECKYSGSYRHEIQTFQSWEGSQYFCISTSLKLECEKAE